jgi:hypothetical protein
MREYGRRSLQIFQRNGSSYITKGKQAVELAADLLLSCTQKVEVLLFSETSADCKVPNIGTLLPFMWCRADTRN